MSDAVCRLERRDEVIVAYLYDDLEARERHAFVAHLAACAICRSEVDDLKAIRVDLAQWTPPEPAKVLAFTPAPPRRSRVLATLAEVPVWLQVAAALLVLGISARAANVQVRIDRDGFSVRTGWAPAAPQPAATSADQRLDAAAPWRADLDALERSIRAELQAPAPPAVERARDTGGDDAILRRVRALIEASEKNQRTELALRVAEVARDFQLQRTADLQRIQRNLNVLETTTGGAIVRHQLMLDRIATRVSQQ
jgi:anti-sigma factor RsiW